MAETTPVWTTSTPLPTTIHDYTRAAHSENTRVAYRGDVRRFVQWGGSVPATPEEVAHYLAAHAATHAVSTLTRWKVAIGKAHTTQGHADPTKTELVKTVLRGIRRTHGTAQRQVEAAVKEDLLSMIAAMDMGMKELRDQALLLLGFAGAFRRSELVGLDVEDIQEVREGLVVTIRRSKTDQEGAGRKVGIPHARGRVCPVKSLRTWLAASGISTGPIFRAVNRHGHVAAKRLSAHAVALVVKERAEAAGLDPAAYSGHSLRAGLATSAAAMGISSHKIRAQTGHRGEAMLQRYIRDGEIFTDNAAGIL